MSVLASNPQVQSYIEKRLELDGAKDTGNNARQIRELFTWFKKVNTSVSVPGPTIPKKGIWFSEPVKKSLLTLSEQLGSSASTLCIASCAITLSTQPTTLVEIRDHIGKSVEEFFDDLKVRVRVASVLLSTIEE